MNIAKLIAILGILAMSAALIYGFSVGNFSSDGADLLRNPWGIVSIVDLYTGFALFSIWIVFREKSLVHAVIWVLLMMILGFFTGSVYMLYALLTSRGDWKVFWMGKHAND